MYRYKKIKLKDGSTRDEHRLIIEKHLGRKLLFDEVVHHINGNCKDNNIKNLKVMFRKNHTIFEMKNGNIPKINSPKRSINKGKVFCSGCKKHLPIINYHKHKNRTFGITWCCKECKSKLYYKNK